MKTVPLRMCAVCREMRPKTELIRVVRGESEHYTVDANGKANGRGAYVCKQAACLTNCIKKRALNRSFKAPLPDSFYAALQAVLEESEK